MLGKKPHLCHSVINHESDPYVLSRDDAPAQTNTHKMKIKCQMNKTRVPD